MKTSDGIAVAKPEQRQPEFGRIRYEPSPGWTMTQVSPQEQPRSRMIGRGWRARLLNAKL
jgi:hypothetical protein